MPDRISTQAGVCGWLAYSPPAEIGKGQEVRAYGPGGFSIWTSYHDGRSAPRQLRNPRPLTFDEARAAAGDVDRYLAFDRGRTCRQWVDEIIADLPVALQEAIDVAKRRTRELRTMLDDAEDAADARTPAAGPEIPF